jgi:AcrR family transcriptional regulator
MMAIKSKERDDPQPGERGSSRAVLLSALSALMTERGTVDISLSDIARHSGLNSAMVKYYFGTKQGMMVALLEDVLGRGLEQLAGLYKMQLSPVEKLKLHINAIIRIYFNYPYINRLIHVLFEDPVSGEIVAEKINKPLAEAQRKLLEEGIAAGVFRPIDPMMFYFIVLGACDHLFFGHHMLRVAFDVPTIDDDLRKRYTNALLEMILVGIVKDKDA